MNITKTDPQQAMLAAIIDSSDDAIISKDLNSRITSWNKAAERIFGYTAGEMIGQLIHRLIPDDRKGEEDEIIARLKRGERVEHFSDDPCHEGRENAPRVPNHIAYSQ